MSGAAARDLAALLAAQDGLVARTQLHALGWSDDRVQAQLHARRWQRIHPGIYAAFTGALGWRQQLVAAVLFAGDGAAVSHESAAALHGFGGETVPGIHVTIPVLRQLQHRPGVRFHRSRRLEESDVFARWPPRTRVERTVLDLVDVAPTFAVAFAWMAAAVQHRRSTAARLQAAVLSRANLRWRGQLRPALADIAGGVHSNLELLDARNDRIHGLPPARRQRAVRRRGGQRWLDADYVGYPLRKELDGRLGHDRLVEKWRDRRRDNDAVVRGGVVLRYGWIDLTDDACATAGEVGAVLNQLSWPGRVRRCGPRCTL